MNPAVPIPPNRIAEFCEANGIGKLSVFGSALREDFGPGNDIDLDILRQTVQEALPDLLAQLEPGTPAPRE